MRTNYKTYVFSKKEWIFCLLQSIGITGVVNLFCYRSWWAWGLVIPVGIWYTRWKQKEMAERRRRILQNHFKDVLQSLQTAVRAGYSMEQSVTECRREMERLFGERDDLVRELRYMESQMQVGVPVEQLFWNLGQRSGVEEGLYSVFAGYDRELLERYHVFMVDGSYGTGVWKPERMYRTVKNCMEESCRPGGAVTGVRGENLWKCSSVSGAITAYTLMSDQHGHGYRAQAVDYMKETLGIQGIQLLIEKYRQQKDIFEEQEKEGNEIDVKQTMDSYEQAKKEAAQNQDSGSDSESQQRTEVSVPADFVNPLDVIRQLQKKGILALVVPPGKEVSQKGLGKEEWFSKREKLTGMGTPFYGTEENTLLAKGIFQAYMMQHLTDYTSTEHISDPLRYQLEYVIGGKTTDQENLKAVVYRLLAAREAANMMYLLRDPTRQSEIHEMALVICAAIGLPALEGIVSLALQAAWAFGESLMDVRQLLAGGKVPLVKTGATWMVSINQLAKLTELLKNGKSVEQKGMTYHEYLGILLMTGKTDTQTERTLDVVEAVMRSLPGKEGFRLDQGVIYLETEMEVSLAGNTFSLLRDYGYAMGNG